MIHHINHSAYSYLLPWINLTFPLDSESFGRKTVAFRLFHFQYPMAAKIHDSLSLAITRSASWQEYAVKLLYLYEHVHSP